MLKASLYLFVIREKLVNNLNFLKSRLHYIDIIAYHRMYLKYIASNLVKTPKCFKPGLNVCLDLANRKTKLV